MSSERGRTPARLLAVIGGVLALVGGVTTVIYIWQPWRSCSGEDTSAGCAMLSGDAAVMAAAMLVVVAGVVLLVVAAVLASSRTGSRRSP